MAKNTKQKKTDKFYVVGITLLTFILAVTMQFLSDVVLEGIPVIYGFFLIVFVILVGIVFDILGVAVTSVSEITFHAMASDKVRGAKQSLTLIKNAEKVSNICNDVIGDVCGIISGSISSIMIAALNISDFNTKSMLLSLCILGAVSALTVGGKAMGKTVAISKNQKIVFTAGKIISFFSLKK